MKFFAGVLAALFALSVLAMPAFASEVGLQFIDRATGNEYGIPPQANPVEICPGPLIEKDATLKVSNVGPSTDTYYFSLQDMPIGWIVSQSKIQPYIMLASGESKLLNLFVLNTYYAEPGVYTQPGTYFFTIKTVSGTDPSYVILKRIQVNILPCFALQLTADQASRETCSEKAEDVGYTLTLKNSGKSRDIFDISAPSPAKLSTASISLEPNQSSTFTVTVPSSGLQGSNAIPVVARGRVTKASANVTLTLNVKDCYSSDIAIDPVKQAGCLGKTAQFKLRIKNTGNGDAYELSLPGWVTADATRFNLDRDAAKEVTLTANPATQGKLSVDVSITSGDKPATKKVSAELDVAECRDIVVIASPASSTVCKGEIAAFDVTVKNRGILEDTITVSASAGSLNLNKLTLAAGQSQTLQLNVDTSAMDIGKSTIEITATDGKVSDKASVDVNVDNCYSSSLEITPNNKSICPFTGFNYTIRLTNTGRQPDSYVMKFKNIAENASLASGQSASWDIPVYSEEPGVYSLTATAESGRSKSNASAVLVVQPLGKCYAVDVKAAEQATRSKVNEAKTVSLTIKNTGIIADDYTLSVDGPSWAYVSPDKVSLEPGVQADVYLYISPPLEADNRSVNIVVNVKSNHAAASTAVTALVGNATLPTGGGFTLDNLTGAIIYDEGSMSSWKVAAIAIIALAIVIILIVRFVLLVKG